MDSQPSTIPQFIPPAKPSMFGSRVPSSISYLVVLLLFFLPFLEIRCNGMKLQTVSGFQLATGFKTDNRNSMGADDMLTKSATKSDSHKPNMYAMAGLALAVLGLILSVVNTRSTAAGGIATGVLGAAALAGLLIDIKKQTRSGLFGDLAEKSKDITNGKSPGVDESVNKVGETLSGLSITVDFAPWFYIALIGFVLAAFFCYKRMTAPAFRE